MKAVEEELMEAERKRDKVMELSRNAIRLAGRAITLLHARKSAEAKGVMAQLKLEMGRLRKVEKGFEYYSMQAHQECVEALAFYTLLSEHRIVSRKDVEEGSVAYLLGIMDLVGELRREATEALIAMRVQEATSYYLYMKGIYDATKAMRFASSVAPEFRRKQDVARIQLESTASELLATRALAGKGRITMPDRGQKEI